MTHEAAAQGKDIFFFIPHSHWEGAVFKTREQYLEMAWPILQRALRLLEMYPEYRFVLDQVCLVKPFLERYPAEGGKLRRLVKEGRLLIAGGLDVMPDVNMPCGESFVRQVLYGKGYFRRELGVDPEISWQLDTFGHHGQMPQLLRLAGYKTFWSQRGTPDKSLPAELAWEGIDGTRIPFFRIPLNYTSSWGSRDNFAEFARFIQDRFDRAGPFALGRKRLGMAGADVCLPEDHVPPLAREFNARADSPFEFRIALPSEYEAAVERHAARRPVVGPDRNPIFQGTYSSRIELKQMTREVERILTAAEKLGVLLGAAGEAADSAPLWQAWEPTLFNHAHDLMSGVMTDHVYEDTLRGYDFSLRLGEEELASRLRRLAARVDTSGEGVPVVVFNPLGWQRTDVVIANVSFSEAEVRDVKVVGPDGRVVPVQIVAADRAENGALLHVRAAFIAAGVPALGCGVYHVVPVKTAPAAAAASDAPDGVLENEHYRVEIDPASGAITRLVAKDGGWDVLAGPGNVVAREPDKGDLWELYRHLDGGMSVPACERHGPPRAGQAAFSNDAGAEAKRSSVRGPVFSEFAVERTLGEKGPFRTVVRLYAGLRRIEIRTVLRNDERFVRYRVLFPTVIAGGTFTHEIPFGAIQRPEGIECPAQTWVDWGDGERGVAMLNVGLPGNNAADGVLMLSLLRSECIAAYGFGGGYERGMSSDTGFCLGKEFTFDYALVPHAGDWRKAQVYRDGQELNHPLIACSAAAHGGRLPRRWGLVEVSPPTVVVSALKAGEDGGVILRMYEAAGEPAAGKVAVNAEVASAEEVNLLEDAGKALTVAGNSVSLPLGSFEIKTIKLRLR
jgi:alpha-mannosidase